jgi:two-component system, OmpR family, sensor kinase
MDGVGRWRDLLGSMRVRILAAVVVLLFGSSTISVLLLRGVLMERLEEEVELNLAKEVEEFELLADRGRNPNTGEPFGSDYAAVFDTYFAREVPDEGETLLAFIDGELYYSARAQDAIPPEELANAVEYWLQLDEREDGWLDTPDDDSRYVALPLRADDQDALFVVANFPRYERDEINNAVRTQALIQLGTIVLASVLGWGLAGRVLRPLQSLADTAQTISETDLTRRIPVLGDDEASRIAIAFNDMLERLEHAFATQRRFLDEASHELRAPLTVIRGHMELLALEDDPEEREATTDLIANEIERMNRMVEDLLTLARAQRPGFLDLDRVDLAELTEDAYRKASVLCRREWVLEGVAHGTIRADSHRITQALMQLAENACQHGGTGTIRMGSSVEDGTAVLWVHDSGAGVPPEAGDQVFERFVKTPGRRESSGLGLSIVAAIAKAHGGRARIARQSGPGARFEITLPVSSRVPVTSS